MNEEKPGTSLAQRPAEAISKSQTPNSGLTPPLAMKELFETQIGNLIPLAGTIELTEEQKDILYAPVNEDDVDIRPDGLVYLPWTGYVERLHKAFGMEWAIIPHGKPELNPSKTGILWGFFLIIKGKPMGYAIGEQEYYSNNAKMSWGDACEGAKSNALMRLCKGLGISIELWKSSFIERWKKEHAEKYSYLNNRNEKKSGWRKKTPAPDTSAEKYPNVAKAEIHSPKPVKDEFSGNIAEAAKPESSAPAEKKEFHLTPPLPDDSEPETVDAEIVEPGEEEGLDPLSEAHHSEPVKPANQSLQQLERFGKLKSDLSSLDVDEQIMWTGIHRFTDKTFKIQVTELSQFTPAQLEQVLAYLERWRTAQRAMKAAEAQKKGKING